MRMSAAVALSALLAASCAFAGEANVTISEYESMKDAIERMRVQLENANRTREGRRLLHGKVAHQYADGTGKYEVHDDGYVHFEPLQLRYGARAVTNRVRQVLRKEELRERPRNMPQQLWDLIQRRRLAEIHARVFEKDAATGEVRETTKGGGK